MGHQKKLRAKLVAPALLSLITSFGANATDIHLNFNSNNGYNFTDKNASVPSWTELDKYIAPTGWKAHTNYLKAGVGKPVRALLWLRLLVCGSGVVFRRRV